MTDLPVVTELGPAMLACSERERRFVWHFLEQGCRDATDAARKAGCPDPGPHSSAIRVRGHELRHRPRVIEAMKEVGRTYFGGLLLPAVLAAEDILLNSRHPDHATMIKAILGSNGMGDRTKVDINVSGQVEHSINRTDAALDTLEEYLSLGVPREKLIERFGYSGLARYERMLEDRQAKSGKSRALPAPVIEAEFAEVDK
jgi:hypothetical protein